MVSLIHLAIEYSKLYQPTEQSSLLVLTG